VRVHRLSTSFVLAYHGCDAEIADELINGASFKLSSNPWDWLGVGVYFWEGDPVRGLEWAQALKKRGKVSDPAVIGVALDLGLCLDLMTRKSLIVLEEAYHGLAELARKAEENLPRNVGEFNRRLDCAVVNYLFNDMPEPKFQTVRAAFPEGPALFPGSKFVAQTHIQIAVRDLSCIKGVFRVPAEQLS
jgi:hypothetical protein